METSNTTENLLNILMAMKKIRPIDQSEYFKKYFAELEYKTVKTKRHDKF